MAERRMFAKKIVQSARFLKMPMSSQCLYFHLGMQADDDGVVEAYPVMNMIKANEDDLRVLVGKSFVKILNEDMVSYLVDWTAQNRIRKDRKQDSQYKDLLLQVIPDIKLIQKVPRSDTRKKDRSGLSTDGPRTAKYSVVEDSTVEDSIGQGSGVPPDTTTPTDSSIKASIAAAPKFSLGKEILTEEAYQALVMQYGKEDVDQVIKRILKKPYMNCLNPEMIGAWTAERIKRLSDSELLSEPAGKRQKSTFFNFKQREYDYDDLQRRLIDAQSLGS